jgi:hypothetical protein
MQSDSLASELKRHLESNLDVLLDDLLEMMMIRSWYCSLVCGLFYDIVLVLPKTVRAATTYCVL